MISTKLVLQITIIAAILLGGCAASHVTASSSAPCCELVSASAVSAPVALEHSMAREDMMNPIILKDALTNIDTLEKTFDWKPFRDGVQIARIYDSPNGGATAAFLKYEPGASVPFHMHGGWEHIFILKGSQLDRSGENVAGTVVINPPGSSHFVASPHGCIVLIIWEKPVVIASETK